MLYELIADARDVEEDERGLKRLRERMLPAWSQVYLTQSVYKVVLKKSIHAQIRQLILIMVIVKDKLMDL